MKLWRNYVKVYQSLDQPAPYYAQWAVWCWRKPIYIGMPLIWLAIPIMLIDFLLAIVYLFVNWGR